VPQHPDLESLLTIRNIWLTWENLMPEVDRMLSGDFSVLGARHTVTDYSVLLTYSTPRASLSICKGWRAGPEGVKSNPP
jgi:hypothetical protein